MIKSISFKENNNLISEEFAIKFTEGTNIIIGPKGGGKSTLLNLLVGATNGYISKGVLEAFKNPKNKREYIPTKLEMVSGEIIRIDNLEIKPIKEFQGKANKLSNVIWQNDDIKYKLDDDKEINKDKKDFLDELIIGNKDIKILIHKLQNIHSSILKLLAVMNKSINWRNIFLMNDKEKKLDIILGLNYSNLDIVNSLDIINSNNDKYINIFKQTVQALEEINKENFTKKQIFKMNLEEKKKVLLLEFKTLYKLLMDKKQENIKIINVLKTFEISLQKIKNEIVNESSGDKIVDKFKAESLFHFEKMAEYLINIKLNMSNFIKDSLNSISIKMGQSKKSGILELKASEIALIDNETIEELLSKILYKSSSFNDVEKWILTQKKKNLSKDFKETQLLNTIKNHLIKYVEVMADGQKYSSLSNGQKSIFGIKFKLNKAKTNSNILFLDQPEDDLDNETVKKELVKSINGFTGQKIIITHNPNVGLLTGSDNVIVADFGSDLPYKKGNIKIENENNNSDAANYLEGGIGALDERYKIIKGVNYDN